MAELPRQSHKPRASDTVRQLSAVSGLGTPMMVTFPGGAGVTLLQDGDYVLIAVELDAGDEGRMLRVPLAAAAYLAGGLAHMAGVHHG